MDISTDSKVQQWFELLDLSEATQKTYTIYMHEFCNCIGKSPTELIAESVQEIKAGKLPSERNTIIYIPKFKKCLKDRKLAPKAQAVAIACVKSFYKAFDVQLSVSIGKIKKPLPLRENQNFLTKEDIKRLIANAKNLRDRAIILTMVSSGMARNEIINLRVKDISFDVDNVGTISIRRQKSQVDYTTFISPEATQALKNYFEERDRSDKLKLKGQNDYVFVTYDRGTPLDEVTFTFIFKQLAVQLGYANGEYQIKSKSHALRKFFASTLENAGMPKNKIDFMLGHAPSGNDLAYFKTDIETLKQLYIKYLPYLTFDRTIEVRSLDTEDAKRLAELEKENQALKKEMQEIKTDLGKRQIADDTLNKLFTDPAVQQMLLKKMKELNLNLNA